MANTKSVLVWVGVVLVVLFLLCGGAAFLGVTWIWGQAVEQPFVKDTLSTVRADPEVIEALGEPIENSWGQNQITLSTGTEQSGEITLQLSGPKGRGRLQAIGSRDSSSAAWEYDVLEVKLSDSDEVIDLID